MGGKECNNGGAALNERSEAPMHAALTELSMDVGSIVYNDRLLERWPQTIAAFRMLA